MIDIFILYLNTGYIIILRISLVMYPATIEGSQIENLIKHILKVRYERRVLKF